MKMKKNIIRIIAVLTIFCSFLGFVSSSTVHAATADNYCPIQAYPLVNRAKTYDVNSGRECGYAAKNDLCTILSFYDADTIIIEYPLDYGGTKIARAEAKDFFIDSNLASRQLVNIGQNLIVYKDKNCQNVFGELYIDDFCIVIGVDSTNNITQILYPITGSNSWKVGFVQGIYDAETGFKKADISDGYYMIFSSYSSSEYRFNIYGGWTENGTNLQIYNGSEYALNEVFVIVKQDDAYVIRCYHCDGKVIDIEMSSGNALMWEYHGQLNQLFDIYENSNGELFFKSRGNDKYLTIDGILENEVNVTTKSFVNNSLNAFILQPVTINGRTYDEDTNLNNNLPEHDTTNSKLQEIIDLAYSQLGVGDTKGNNAVIYNDFFYGRKISGQGYPWCQAFISWLANECSVLDTVIPNTASCYYAKKWFQDRGQFEYAAYYGGDYIPQPGCLVFYGKNGNEHVGLLIDVSSDGYLCVIEGNIRNDATGNYEVTLFTHNSKRTLSSSYVYGYGIPNYD